ncbi:MAG: PIN domain-containing protein [Bacteroidota bacterium]
MTHVFIDPDVLLDVVTGRLPFSKEAGALFTLIEKNQLKGYASALSFSNIYYVLRKHASHSRVIKSLNELSDLVDILQVDQSIVKTALQSGFGDFEDALRCYAAQSNPEIKMIITRNTKDFKKSDLPAMTPNTFLKTVALLGQSAD